MALRLTNPPMGTPSRRNGALEARTVSAIERKLGLPVTGHYSPTVALGVAEWEWRTGIKQSYGALSIAELQILLGYAQPTAAMRLTAKARRAAGVARKLPASISARYRQNVGAQAVDLMLALVGCVERPAGSNVVPEIKELIRRAGFTGWYLPMGYYYCAITGSAALAIAGAEMGKAVREGKLNGAYCPSVLAAAKRGEYGMRIVHPADVRKGDIVLFDWQDDSTPDHFGMATGPVSGGVCPTVEANTSSGNSGSQSNGDGVFRRERPLGVIQAFVRCS